MKNRLLGGRGGEGAGGEGLDIFSHYHTIILLCGCNSISGWKYKVARNLNSGAPPLGLAKANKSHHHESNPCFKRPRNTENGFFFCMSCSWSMFMAAKRLLIYPTRSYFLSGLLLDLFLRLLPNANKWNHRDTDFFFYFASSKGSRYNDTAGLSQLLTAELSFLCGVVSNAKKDVKPRMFLLVIFLTVLGYEDKMTP